MGGAEANGRHGANGGAQWDFFFSIRPIISRAARLSKLLLVRARVVPNYSPGQKERARGLSLIGGGQ